MDYKSSGNSYGDTSKIPTDKFSVRANKGVLNNFDKSSYEVPAPRTVKGISSK